ncbi:XRE family transcriptional regulator [Sphingomonas sp. Leaf4]|uniref:XRE family transcriptional regulator n=1 Tax=Sphingomonas sp. Leaf4 TaxID=2876553 RepID=UPI001E639368|nr:XRE family transcriptional regulator [Sphingomonas sp. Leaf4]
MLYADFLVEMERASLTVRGFAQLIGMNPNSITNYAARGQVPQHIAIIAVLVSEMTAHGVGYADAITKVAPGRQPRGRPRGQFGSDRQPAFDLGPSAPHVAKAYDGD